MTSSPHAIWAQTVEEVYTTLGTTPAGLAADEAARRLAQFGANELPEPALRPLWLRFTDQLTHFMALLLWIAGILAFISRTPELGWAIWAVILVNAAFSFWQEFQAERALAALKKVLPLHVRVYRNGQLTLIPARELVRGDIIQLEEGDKISADARLLSAESLYVDVSVLTGESLPVVRSAQPIQFRELSPVNSNALPHRQGEPRAHEQLNPAEIPNLVLAGSTVTSGRAVAAVYAAGGQTELGHVAHLTSAVQREPSTLEVQVAQIVQVITVIALSMGLAVFVLSAVLLHLAITESFVFAIGIIVANVPEGLLPTVTLALALGVQRMTKQKALVRRLSAIETLSATTVICTDKTGTLTQNEMTVRYLWLPSSAVASSPLRHYEPLTPTPVPLTEETSVHDLLSLGLIKVGGEGYDPMTGTVDIPDDSGKSWKVHLLVAGAALCSNARLLQLTGPSRWQEIGDPTEAALLVVATKAGLDLEQLHVQAPRLREVPFDSRRRMMTVVLDWHAPDLWPSDVPYLAFTKGAPLEVLRCCTSILRDDQAEELSHADWEHIVTTNDALARQGFRLLAVAVRRGGKELLAVNSHELERDLTFLGLVAMFDPPHPEVPEAIARCHTAGLTVTMITGDYSLTAEAIARQIGLTHGQMRAVTGESIDRLSDAQFRQVLKYGTGLVFARMSPEHKLRVVQTYKDLGAVVAVTGDGVNDAPALRTAHIGIAMGRNGTDVAREAADLVLTDDNFTTIVSAVEQGRAIYSNIRKFMTYILASNVPEIVPFLAMVAFNIPPALTIMQILAIDLGTDLVPALALGAEPAEPGSMERPARAKSEFLLSRALLLRAYGFLGMIEATLAMCGFFFVWWSYEYTLADLQAVTPALLAHTADAAVLQIYQQATTMTLAVIVACQVGNLFACRSDRLSALRVTWTRNWLLWVGIAVECLTLVALIYVPPLSRILGTAPLAPGQWLLLGVCPLVMCIAEELRKRTVRRMHSLPG